MGLMWQLVRNINQIVWLYVMKNNRNGMYLAFGYLIGQGSVFLFQAILKYFGFSEVVGLSVLFVSLISFAYQFGDYGNVNFLIKNEISRNDKAVNSFLFSRSLLAFFLTSLMSFSSYFLSYKNEFLPVYFVLPVIAAIAGGTRLSRVETNDGYKSLAIMQCSQWLGLVISLICFYFVAEFYISLVFCLLVVLFNYFKAAGKYCKLETSGNIFLALPFLISPIFGQVWGRISMFLLESVVGLSQLGEFGLVRYFQIALILLVGFWVRPRLKDYATNVNRDEVAFGFSGVWMIYRKAILVVLLSVLGLFYVLKYVPQLNSEWWILATGVPFTVFGQAATFLNQNRLPPVVLFFVEWCAVLLNVFVFLRFLNGAPPLAFLLAELSQALFLIAVSVVIVPKRKFW